MGWKLFTLSTAVSLALCVATAVDGLRSGVIFYAQWGVVHWCIILGASVLPLYWVVAEWKRNLMRVRRKRGLCSRCGYDLRATPGRCPECGTPASDKAARD